MEYHLQKEHDNKIENHHFFKLLNGHPLAISLVASLLENKSLEEVYELSFKNFYDTL